VDTLALPRPLVNCIPGNPLKLLEFCSYTDQARSNPKRATVSRISRGSAGFGQQFSNFEFSNLAVIDDGVGNGQHHSGVDHFLLAIAAIGVMSPGGNNASRLNSETDVANAKESMACVGG
jgi:hypothetical protein